MALSGSFYKYVTGYFGLYCEWSASQSVRDNYSTVKIDVYQSYYNVNPGGTGAVKIDSAQESVAYESTYTYGDGWKRKYINSFDFTVWHNADGTKSVNLSVSWEMNSNASDDYVSVAKQTITATTTVTLDKIDRTAPTISVTVSNIGMSSFKLNASANSFCDMWEYRIDSGAWVSITTNTASSVSINVTGLQLNATCSVQVRARNTTNHVYGSSETKFVTTLGSSVLNSITEFYADNTPAVVPVNMTVHDAGVSHTISFYDGDIVLFTISGLYYATGTGFRNITLTSTQRLALLNAMPNVKTKEFTVKMSAYSGNRLLGSDEKTATVKTSATTSAPTFTSFGYADISGCDQFTGSDQILIQEASSLLISAAAATAKNGASIVSYTAVIKEKSVSSETTEIFFDSVSHSGEITLIVTATDSRGYVTSISKYITVLEYAKPRITSYAIRRQNGVDAPITVSFSGRISALKPDGKSNVNTFVSAMYRYKSTAEDTYSDYVDITAEVGVSSDGAAISFVTDELLVLPTDGSYDIHFLITDMITHGTLDYVIPQGTPMIAVRRDKIGINNRNPVYTIDIVGDINLTGGIYINGESLAKVLGLGE